MKPRTKACLLALTIGSFFIILSGQIICMMKAIKEGSAIFIIGTILLSGIVLSYIYFGSRLIQEIWKEKAHGKKTPPGGYQHWQRTDRSTRQTGVMNNRS